MTLTPGQRRYGRVNATWPSELPKLEGEEAVRVAKRLYRLAMGKAFVGKFRITSGNRHTWIRGGVFVVNPDKGWHSLVHDISHYAHSRLHPDRKPHDFLHTGLERRLIEAVVSKGWLSGTLKPPPRKRQDVRDVRYQRVLVRIKSWETKRKRADNALKKLLKQRAYYEKAIGEAATSPIQSTGCPTEAM